MEGEEENESCVTKHRNESTLQPQGAFFMPPIKECDANGCGAKLSPHMTETPEFFSYRISHNFSDGQ